MRMLAAALLCVAGSAAAQGCPAKVRVSFPNFPIPPLVLGTDTIPAQPGQLVTWTRNALRKSGCKSALVFLRRPPNRQLARLLIVFAVIITPSPPGRHGQRIRGIQRSD